MRAAITLVMLFLFLIPISLGYYAQDGGSNSDYYFTETAIYNGQNISIGVASVTNPQKVAMSFDFDGDGDEEIIVANADTLYAYSRSMTLIDSIDFKAAGETGVKAATHDMAIANLDSDSDYEIAVLGVSGSVVNVEFFDFNGTDFTNYSKLLAMSNSNTDFADIECDTSTRLCIVMSGSKISPNSEIYIGTINMSYGTTLFNSTTVYTNTDGTAFGCAPRHNPFVIEDYDNDGNMEVIISYLDTKDSAAETMNIKTYTFSIANGAPTLKDSVSETLALGIDGDGCQDSENEDMMITGPMPVKFQSAETNKYDIVVGVAYDESYPLCDGTYAYKIYAYNENLDLIDDYPEDGEFTLCNPNDDTSGDYVGNLFRMDISNGYGKDICMPIYDHANSKLKVLCATKYLGGLVVPGAGIWDQHHLYQATLGEGTFNATPSYYNRSIGNTFAVSINGTVRHYFASSMGIFKYDLGEVYSFTYPYLAVSPTLYDKNEDLLGIDASSVYLFSASPIEYYCGETRDCYSLVNIRPSTANVWYWNTTVSVTTKVYDPNDDWVQVLVNVYEGDVNQQSTGWLGNYTNDEAPIFTQDSQGQKLWANKTGDNYRISIYFRNKAYPGINQSIRRYFSVSPDYGDEEGDSIETISGETDQDKGTSEPQDDTMDYNDNAVENTIRVLADLGGFSMKVWVILTAIIAGFVVVVAGVQSHYPLAQSTAFGGAAMFFVIFIGVLFRIISAAYIIVPLVLVAGIFILTRFVFPATGES